MTAEIGCDDELDQPDTRRGVTLTLFIAAFLPAPCTLCDALRRFETLRVRFEMTKTPVGSGHETHVREKTGFSPYVFSQRHPPPQLTVTGF